MVPHCRLDSSGAADRCTAGLWHGFQEISSVRNMLTTWVEPAAALPPAPRPGLNSSTMMLVRGVTLSLLKALRSRADARMSRLHSRTACQGRQHAPEVSRLRGCCIRQAHTCSRR